MPFCPHTSPSLASIPKNQVADYVNLGQLKYYFKVDNKYVLRKLGLLLFPFVNRVRRNGFPLEKDHESFPQHFALQGLGAGCEGEQGADAAGERAGARFVHSKYGKNRRQRLTAAPCPTQSWPLSPTC